MIGCPGGGPDLSAPTVALADFQLEGLHTPKVVQKIVELNGRDASKCYAETLAPDALTTGALEIALTVEESGTVARSSARAVDAALAPVVPCLSRLLPLWTFVSAPEGTGAAEVKFRYVLGPSANASGAPELQAEPGQPDAARAVRPTALQ